MRQVLKTNKAIKNRILNGFTIIELLVVVMVMAILLAIVIVGYGSWRQSLTTSQLKSDLTGAVSAMESTRNSTSAFPSDVNALSNFKASNGTVLSGGSIDGISYCINATSATTPSLKYYITNGQTAQPGTCPTLGCENPLVTIGSPAQTWCSKNLNVGTMINSSVQPANNSVVEKYCYSNNTISGITCDGSPNGFLGGLYSWDEAMGYSTTEGAQGICPKGYHIPTVAEWNLLISNMGGGSTAAQNIKVGGSSGFNSIYAGWMNFGSGYVFANYGSYSYFWTSSSYVTGWPYFIYVNSSIYNPPITVTYGPKTNENYSVRCIKG